MKVVFAHDHTFYEDKSGKFYSSGKLPYEVWLRYLKIFDEVIVVGRGSPLDISKAKSLNVSSGPRVSFQTVPNINKISSKYLSNFKKARSNITKALKKADCLIARLPSQVGGMAIDIAKELNIPYAIEMVGDPWDAYWYHGNWKGKILAPIFSYRTKSLVRNSEYVLYVTREYLQNKYPTLGIQEFCSNVEIREPSIQTLENRIKKINNRKQNDTIVLGLIGSLNANYKGIDTALKAIQIVRDKLPEFKFKILGDGNQEKWREAAKHLDLLKHIEFSGVLPGGNAVEQWLDNVDIYMQPSLTEGLPRALAEAMSRGCPAIASNVGGIPELLDVEECLHVPKDHLGLSELILKALDKNWQLKQAERNFLYASNYYSKTLEVRRFNFWNKFYNYSKMSKE